MKIKRIILLLIFIVVAAVLFNINSILKIFYPIKYSEQIIKYSEKYNIDPYYVAAIIKTESNYDVNAKSSKSAYGLMQITDSTASWAAEKMDIKNYKKEMLYDPDFNINMGCWYLNELKTEFGGNMNLVLAAYNGGRGNVEKWLNESEHSNDGKNLHYIPFQETDKYVKKVNTNYEIYKKLYENL